MSRRRPTVATWTSSSCHARNHFRAMMRSQRATATLLSLLQTPRVQTAALLSLLSFAIGVSEKKTSVLKGVGKSPQ